MKNRLTIVVGVTGGIAAYKAVSLVRSFVTAGHWVQVIATDAALRFVGAPTFEAISRNPVNTGLYDDVSHVRHVAMGRSADLIVIAPATANTIAKLATGLADDLLTSTVLASSAPLVLAPAMHTEMWQHPATVANIATLRKRGVMIVGPASGPLTGGDVGEGRMEEPEAIAAAALEAAGGTKRSDTSAGRGRSRSRTAGSAAPRSDLAGRRVLVTAGGTREPLDPVRFLGNRSSGKQGVAIAAAAQARGADVTLVAANLQVDPPAGVRVVEASTADELRKAVSRIAPETDAIVMAAAVADFRPAQTRESKIKKTENQTTLVLELVRNRDILRSVTKSKRDGQVVVGFAAETEADPGKLIEIGQDKVRRKGCDFLVINRVGWDTGFGVDDTEVVMLDSGGDIVMEAAGTKVSVADRILDVIVRSTV